MKLNIVGEEVVPSLNGTSRSIVRGHLGVQSGQPRVPKNFEAVACLCFIKNLFLSFCARDAQHFLPLHRLSTYFIYPENRV